MSDTLAATGRWPAYTLATETANIAKRAWTLSAKPNPFKGETQIAIGGNFLGKDNVSLTIMDIKGRVIEHVSDRMLKKENGTLRYSWSPSAVTAGVYIARITLGDKIIAKPIFLMK